MLPGLAESAQVRITGYDNLPVLRQRVARVSRNHALHQAPIGDVVGLGLRGVKSGVFKKLERRTSKHETVLRVRWRRLTPVGYPLAVRVIVILPDQFVGECEGVPGKFKMPSTGGLWCGAAGKSQRQEEPG